MSRTMVLPVERATVTTAASRKPIAIRDGVAADGGGRPRGHDGVGQLVHGTSIADAAIRICPTGQGAAAQEIRRRPRCWVVPDAQSASAPEDDPRTVRNRTAAPWWFSARLALRLELRLASTLRCRTQP